MNTPTDLRSWMDAESIKAADLARELGCGRHYITHVRNGGKSLSKNVAIKLYRKRGVKFGPIAGASPAEINALERVLARQAA